MLITPQGLDILFNGFKATFSEGAAMAAPMSHWKDVAMEVPSSTETETYAWLGDTPRMREWLGERVIKSLSLKGYRITNRTWESTIRVPRTKVEDDTYGTFAPMLRQMGVDSVRHPDELVFGLLAAGFLTPCFDGQYFFDTDHPVGNGADRPFQSVSNVQTGTGPAWYLLDCSQAIKPMVYQNRITPTFTSLTKETDHNVFWDDDYIYGIRARSNVGYGLWQMAYASRAPLTAANYEAARQAMQAQVNDEGRPLGVMPTHLVVSPTLDGDARRLLVSSMRPETVGMDTVAVTNEWAGSARMIMSQYLVPAA